MRQEKLILFKRTIAQRKYAFQKTYSKCSQFVRLISSILFLGYIVSCQKEKISIGTNVSDTFYLDNAGASMRILIEGNTLSHTFLIIVHGGPGTGSSFYNTDYISQNIEDKYAVVYWDQRNSGASQGNSNGNNLNLTQMTDDLKKVIQVIKSRYGTDGAVFILGHSFGGLLATSFMTSSNNQSMVKGWIFVDGSHNYPLNDTLTRQMLQTTGQQQIDLNKNADKWSPILTWCNAHPGNFTLAESDQLATFATSAETYMDEVNQFDYLTYIKEHLFSDNLTLTALLFNHLYSENATFNNELAKTEFSSTLYKVIKPTLILFGQYDFICPKGLGDDVFKRISSPQKRMVISTVSGHNFMFQDEGLFCYEVNNFIQQFK